LNASWENRIANLHDDRIEKCSSRSPAKLVTIELPQGIICHGELMAKTDDGVYVVRSGKKIFRSTLIHH
jgi:hypothetical protein